jgi:hypothetical protein
MQAAEGGMPLTASHITVNMRRAREAFNGQARRPDEAIHLLAAMSFSGFCDSIGVIGFLVTLQQPG